MDLERLRESLSNRTVGPIDGASPSAVLVPLVKHNGERYLLYQVRASTLSFQPGEVCFPGGRMEPGEDALECALREMEEELGISREKIDVIGPMDYAIHSGGFPVFPFLVRLEDDWEQQIKLNPAEVDSIFTIPLSFLRYNPPQQARVERSYHPMDHLSQSDLAALGKRPRMETMPTLFWPYEGKMLWGLSARITAWLLHWLDEHR